MALLPAALLTQVWNVNPGASTWYGGAFAGLQLGTGGLLLAGESTGGALGVNLVKFDPSTGEPTAFDEDELAAAGNWLAIFHQPSDSSVILFGIDSVGTSANPRTLYAQRVVYDISAGTLTGGPVATWDVNNGTNDLLFFAANVTDNLTLNVLGWGALGFGRATMHLGSGTVSPRVDSTIADAGFGGGINRLELGLAGVHGAGTAIINGYVNASGAGTGVAHVVVFSTAGPTATALGLGRLTAYGDTFPLSATSTWVNGVQYNFGASDFTELDATGTTALPLPEVVSAATVWASNTRATYAGKFVAFNREGATFNAFNVMRARRYDPITGTEIAAYEYPLVYTSFGPVGMFTSNQRFWWADFGASSFRVYENLAFGGGQGKWGRVRWG